jgi:tRNA-Thr(GGU) m(6)t(6)A37 methyltransferase TsaA
VNLQPIGTIRTGRTERAATPVQSAVNLDEHGTIELDPAYADGLDGLEGFTHLWLLTWLGAGQTSEDTGEGASPPALRQVPFLLGGTGREIGIFATRGPRRPNSIGLSLVRLVSVDGAIVRFAGVDMVDGTPLLDLKPYVAQFDRPTDDVRSGWFDTIEIRPGVTPGDLRLTE